MSRGTSEALGEARRVLRVLAYPAPADLRKGYNGLSGLVLQDLRKDPLSGDCFLFVNRKRDQTTQHTHFAPRNGALRLAPAAR